MRPRGPALQTPDDPGTNDLSSPLAEKFSLIRNGPAHRFLFRLSRAVNERRQVMVRALLAVLVTWLPLVIFVLIQGLAYNSQIRIPFFRDFAVNVRFLIALPILILAESSIDQRWRILVLQFLKSGLLDEKELHSFEDAIESTTRLRDRWLPEVVILIAALLPSIFITNTESFMNGVSSWHTLSVQPVELSLAGWWFNLVSLPIFRFMLFRWFWRMFLWAWFLWHVARINLRLVTTHADKAAGLGFLTSGQKAFAPIVFAGGSVMAAQIGNAIAYEGATLRSLNAPMIAYGLMAMVILVVPLLVVTPLLRKVKKQALLKYGALVTAHNQHFETKWIGRKLADDELLLGKPDASSLIDLASSFMLIRQMRIVPIDRQTLILLAFAAVSPVVPILFFVTPTDQLIRIVLKMLGW
jgi:hypothetical protein